MLEEHIHFLFKKKSKNKKSVFYYYFIYDTTYMFSSYNILLNTSAFFIRFDALKFVFKHSLSYCVVWVNDVNALRVVLYSLVSEPFSCSVVHFFRIREYWMQWFWFEEQRYHKNQTKLWHFSFNVNSLQVISVHSLKHIFFCVFVYFESKEFSCINE